MAKLTELMQDPLIFPSSRNAHSYSNIASASGFQPKEMKSVVVADNKKVEKIEVKKEKEKKEKGKEKAPGNTPTMFLTAPLKTVAEPSLHEIVDDEYVADSNGDDGGFDDSDNDGIGGFFVDNPTSLIDIKSTSKSNGATNKGGRPKKSLLDDLLQKCYQQSAPEKHLFRCVGSCGMTYVNRNLTRAIRHATGCHRLPAPLRIRAKSYAASKAPSRKLSVDKSESTKVNDVEVVLGGNSKESNVGTGVVALKKRKLNDGSAGNSKTSELYEEAKKLGRKDRHLKLDVAVVKFFCCSGIPTSIADHNVWKELLNLADPTYHLASRAKLEEEHIVGEAENVQQTQIAYLKTQNNITVSCDGGTTRGRDAFWTLHMSTEERKVYLMDVREATAESHTAAWIKSYVLEACVCYHHSKYRS